ncbi:hypothetical protein A2U01_0074833, partial [Trifolium medium]|nr:hypothetical protein [Trifolium medium]
AHKPDKDKDELSQARKPDKDEENIVAGSRAGQR